jgi:hypothetical protein
MKGLEKRIADFRVHLPALRCHRHAATPTADARLTTDEVTQDCPPNSRLVCWSFNEGRSHAGEPALRSPKGTQAGIEEFSVRGFMIYWAGQK